MMSPASAFLVVSLLLASDAMAASQISSRFKSTCDTLPSELHITKGTFVAELILNSSKNEYLHKV